MKNAEIIELLRKLHEVLGHAQFEEYVRVVLPTVAENHPSLLRLAEEELCRKPQ